MRACEDLKPCSTHPFNQPPIKEVEQLSIKEAESLRAFIYEHPYKGDEKDYVLRLLCNRIRPPYAIASCRVAVLGVTGGGKSHTIVSIVDLDIGSVVSIPRSYFNCGAVILTKDIVGRK